jgi:Fe-S-cluster containining protein
MTEDAPKEVEFVGLHPTGPGKLGIGVWGDNLILSDGLTITFQPGTKAGEKFGGTEIVDSDEVRRALGIEADGYWFNKTLCSAAEDALARADRLNLDCGPCGACCHSMKKRLRMMVNLKKPQKERLEKTNPGSTEWRGDTDAIKFVDVDEESAACMFWKMENGCSHCSIYDHRPQPCWFFPVGMIECLMMRDSYFATYPDRDVRTDEEKAEYMAITCDSRGRQIGGRDGKEGPAGADRCAEKDGGEWDGTRQVIDGGEQRPSP